MGARVALGDGASVAGNLLISCAGADAALARLAADALSDAGYSCVMRDHGFDHAQFLAALPDALKRNARLLALLSPDYFADEDCVAEATAALAADPHNRLRRLAALRVAPCEPHGLLAGVSTLDIADFTGPDAAEDFRAALLAAAEPGSLTTPPAVLADRLRPPTHRLHADIAPQPLALDRPDALTALDDALTAGGAGAAQVATRAVSLCAPSGVDVAAVARAYAWARRARYAGVHRFNARTEDSLAAGLLAFRRETLEADAEKVDRAAAAQEALAAFAADETAKPWLLLYENAVSPEAARALVPPRGAHVILTLTEDRSDADIRLDAPSRDEAVALIHAAAGRQNQTEAVRLAECLEDDGTALTIAARLSVAAEVDFIDVAVRVMNLQRAAQTPEAAQPLAACVALALAHVVADHPRARDIASLAARLDPDAILTSLLVSSAEDAIADRRALRALIGVGLMQRTAAENGALCVRLHPRVASAIRLAYAADAAQDGVAAVVRVADAFPFDADDHRCWPDCERLQGHADAVLDHADDAGPAAAKSGFLLNQFALYLRTRRANKKAERLLIRALGLTERQRGRDHPYVATALNNLAGLFQDQGRYIEAEPLFERAAAIYEAVLGPQHMWVATSLGNLARLYEHQGRYKEAEPLLRRALSIRENLLGPDEPGVAHSLHSLAEHCRLQRRHAEAEPLYRRALKIIEREFGGGHPTATRIRAALDQNGARPSPTPAALSEPADPAPDTPLTPPPDLETSR